MGSASPRVKHGRRRADIRSGPSYWRRALSVTIVVAGLGIAWYIYDLGQQRAGFDRQKANERYAELQAEFIDIQKENRRLRDRVALLETNNKVDSEAYRRVESQLSQLQEKILDQQEELGFYEGIVGPSQSAGLRVQDFELAQGIDSSAYRVHLVLAQALRNDRRVSGYVELMVKGVADGEMRTLNLRDLAADGHKNGRLDFSFRYFQNLQANLVLPDGFAPSLVIVKLTPSGKKAEIVEKTYEWAILAG
jgi:hypothetical protein